MIPPRHRPYFETEHPRPRDAAAASNDASLYHYDVANSLYHEAPKDGATASVSFVDKQVLYRSSNGHVMLRRDTADDQALKCKEFVVGNPDRGEFYSPNFPGNYPNHSDCIKILAAEPGHLLRLDFRDKFDLESSNNCTYDYLEVRDGGHGFDRLINKFCGSNFPPMIMSTSRYLWLRFVSDDTIEGSGFTAVYESVLPPPGIEHKEIPPCEILATGYEGWLNSTDISSSYLEMTDKLTKPIDCMWIVNVTEGWKIQLVFKTFKLDKPNDCESNFIDIFSPNTEVKYRVRKFCSSMAEIVSSNNSILYVRYYADKKARNSTFSSVFTAFREVKKEGDRDPGGCLEDEFDCQDERCIKKELECNGIENCRFRWDDDDHCLPTKGTLADTLRAEHIIIILVIFCLILSGMCFTFIFNCVRKLIHDQRIIQEHMRQSRQSRLDQVGKTRGLAPPKTASVGRSRSNSSSGGAGGASLSPHHLLQAVRTAVTGSDQHISHRSPAPEECYVPGAGDLMPILLGASRSGAGTGSTPTDTRGITTAVPANGDAVFPSDDHPHEQQQAFEEDDDLEMSTFPMPEMRDNECQTRESLFMNTNSDRSLTPPPPPPPVSSRFNTSTSGSHRHASRPTPQQSVPPQHSSSNTSAFSTFGYTREPPRGRDESGGSSSRTATMPHPHHHHHHHQHPPVSPESQRFRAEAVIEMEQRDGSSGDGVPPPPPPVAVPPPPGSRPFSVESTKSAPDVIVTH
ncbi:uncharacterized protein Neto [Periplaneta americana]|uniref:uncharacterized protein Neto n=1 Tax=Periplaneta americana TaxID=6978 RepID=UPI0037E8BF4A